jgi:RimJ/RimL family protein N-acetyltransferase
VRIHGDGFDLVPDDPRFAADVARAFEEDPHLAVDWGIDEIVTLEQATEWLTEHAELWERGEGRHLAVVDGDEFLGGVNFHRFEPMHARAEVGFWLVPGARGRGIGSAAVRTACEWAFGHWDLHRIEMTTLPDNGGALALADKIGFTREGLLRQRNFERGKHVDIVMLAVLRGELR